MAAREPRPRSSATPSAPDEPAPDALPMEPDPAGAVGMLMVGRTADGRPPPDDPPPVAGDR